MENNLPEITKRIQYLIDKNFHGNVRQFCVAMGMSNSAKVNRLFLKDKRNDEYPMPSTDIILLISNTFDVSTDWLLKGLTSHENGSVNNITIDNKKVQGEQNIVESDNASITTTNEDYLEIIKQQQEQINNLLQLLKDARTK